VLLAQLLEFKLKLGKNFEGGCWKKFTIAIHEKYCKWCQDDGFSPNCRGYGGAECTDKLAIEVFGGDTRIQSEEEIKSGLIQRESLDWYDRMVDEGYESVHDEENNKLYMINFGHGNYLIPVANFLIVD
jgi:hypothetical protein